MDIIKSSAFGVFAALVILFTPGCKKAENTEEPDKPAKTVAVTGVTLSPATLEMTVGEEQTLRAEVAPTNATNKSITWTSSTPTVATVADGKVTAVSAGSATITVTTVDGGKTATCAVTVAALPVPVQAVSLNKTTLELNVGTDFTLVATVEPANADNPAVTWETSKAEVATVEDGKVTGVAEGTATITVKTVDGGKTATCEVTVSKPVMPVSQLEAEQLASLLTARADHIAFVANGEIVVAGGHVNGFKPTNSAEYYKDGQWTAMSMTATHDIAFSVLRSDGKMMIGGGCSSGSGVGQSTSVDVYDPANHSFTAGPDMITARTMPHAVEIADGKILVSGNWYNSDNLEMYNPSSSSFSQVKNVSVERYSPYLFRTAADNAIIFTDGSVDRYDGDAFTFDLFESWKPYAVGTNWRPAVCSIGEYSYLLLLQSKSNSSHYAIGKLEGEDLSLVETDFEFPNYYNDYWIYYDGQVFALPEKNTAYVLGFAGEPSTGVYYIVMVIDYSSTPAKVSMKATELIRNYVGISGTVLLPDGTLVLTGGIYNSNYTPYDTVWALKP